jgi:L-ascorbate metabolism protein UlaG (beta-lactamase superfamily)
MEKILVPVFALILGFAMVAGAAAGFEKDSIETSSGELNITFIGHGTLMFTFGGKVLHVDPFSRLTDYAQLPDADIVFITHDHRDHLDMAAIDHIRKKGTVFVSNESGAGKLEGAIVMKNGDVREIDGLKVEAVPAYNLVHMRSEGVPYHPQGNGNGYVITFGNKRVYVAGDTENVPEMKDLKGVDVAFLPMNLPYTMTPEMMAGAAKSFNPGILYPYHYGDTDPALVADLLKDTDIEVRIRKMK